MMDSLQVFCVCQVASQAATDVGMSRMLKEPKKTFTWRNYLESYRRTVVRLYDCHSHISSLSNCAIWTKPISTPAILTKS